MVHAVHGFKDSSLSLNINLFIAWHDLIHIMNK